MITVIEFRFFNNEFWLSNQSHEKIKPVANFFDLFISICRSLRWVTDLKGTGPLPVDKLNDNGFSFQASGMIVDRKLQGYGTYSWINGQYGDPSEYTLGLNWFPFKTKAFRVNGEYIIVKNSPVGYLSYPTVVGPNGSVFMLNLELFY